jgi:hypothetical protein
MKLSPKKQQGMTMISMTCVAIVVVSMFLLALNIIPIYMGHGKVTNALNSIKNNPEARNETPDQLSTRLFKLLSIDNADSLLTKDDVTINREDTGTTKIHIKYDVIKKVVGNASILVEFDDTVDIGK